MFEQKVKDIYFMGIGGTAMGSLAGLLKSAGFNVRGSDNNVYSPMKEKLASLNIDYQTPYDQKNLHPKPDLVIVGNVIRRDNPESLEMQRLELNYESFPSFLNKYFLSNRKSLVISGTHGKTTSSSLLAHTLFSAKKKPGFLIGGILKNFNGGFLAPLDNGPFVIEGDEYDTAYFDKQPKFMHYKPNILLLTSIEFDHADIYKDLDAVINAFSNLLKTMTNNDIIIANSECKNIKTAISLSHTKAKIYTYGETGDFRAKSTIFDNNGLKFNVFFKEENLGEVFIPLYGKHNLMNALGVYAMAHSFLLTHQEICEGFKTFLGVKRRLEEIYNKNSLVAIDDFAHHPTAVRETILAAKQKYPDKKLIAIFEPRSATSCMKIFEDDYASAFLNADRVMIAPVGRNLAQDQIINTHKIAQLLNDQNIEAQAFTNYEDFKLELSKIKDNNCLLFMSNGDFGGLLSNIYQIFDY